MLHGTEHLVVEFRVTTTLQKIRPVAMTILGDMDEYHHHTLVSLLYRLPRINDLRINVQNGTGVYADIFRAG
jgi:hypothetical protein